MNYIERAGALLAQKINVEDDLHDLYLLLVLTTGTRTDDRHVHDAWAIWRNKTNPDHKSLIPFNELSEEVQAMDTEYVDAIVATARQLLKPQPTKEV